MKSFTYAVILGLVLIMLTGCVPGNPRFTIENPAGFFWGVWHGWIAPVSLIIGLFNENVHLYEPENVGWFYDLGFYISIIAGFGSFSLFRRKGKR